MTLGTDTITELATSNPPVESDNLENEPCGYTDDIDPEIAVATTEINLMDMCPQEVPELDQTANADDPLKIGGVSLFSEEGDALARQNRFSDARTATEVNSSSAHVEPTRSPLPTTTLIDSDKKDTYRRDFGKKGRRGGIRHAVNKGRKDDRENHVLNHGLEGKGPYK